MNVGNFVRVVAVVGACAAAVGSASSSNNNQNASMMPQYGQQQNGPPPAQPMDPSQALGLWRSNFGAVKIESDNSKGGVTAGAVQGVWLYMKDGREVVGYFWGALRGNVMQFSWQEQGNPPLTGEGFITFDANGRQFNGRWWSQRRDRVGDWTGWRQGAGGGDPNGGQYGGQGYGGSPYGGQPMYPPPGGQGYQPAPYQPYSQPPAPAQPAQPGGRYY